MSANIPVITSTLGVRPELADKVIAGLKTRRYIRDGGVIRHASGKKEIVAWLRDVAQVQSVDANVLRTLGPLLQLNVATSVLNLSIATIGFVMVLQRLESIQGQLKTITAALAEVNHKLDLSFYANFRAALELAKTASIRDDINRRVSATQAINRFLEAEQHYLGLLDNELQVCSPAVSPFLSTLFLAYVSTARCYLELGETERAWGHLQEGETALSSRVKQYYDSIIGANPAIFLHPKLANTISLERLTRSLHHYDDSLTESAVFETLRVAIWETASQKPETWIRRLPAAVWNHNVDGRIKKGPMKFNESGDDKLKQVIPRLGEAFAQMELAQESLSCLEGYGIELKYLLDNNIEYAAWQQIELPANGPDDPVAILLPQDSELLTNRLQI